MRNEFYERLKGKIQFEKEYHNPGDTRSEGREVDVKESE